jgi:3-hydroxy acid dehydrogenase/malonic semialdehyde reductase
MGTLRGKTVLVTGASAGIGRAVAVACARAEGRLILLARRGDRLRELAAELRESFGSDSIAIVADLRDRTALQEALDGLPPLWKEIDLLVNNAGLARGLDPLQAGDPDDWDEVFDVNVRALLCVTRWVLPAMLERGSGHIINLGSIAGFETYPGGAVYCASKFAVRAITRGLKMDLQGTPIRVTSIDPGLVETEFSLARFKGDAARAQAPYQGLKPLSADDIAEAVVWSATRPAHVNVMSMTLFPTSQASAQMVHREARKGSV